MFRSDICSSSKNRFHQYVWQVITWQCLRQRLLTLLKIQVVKETNWCYSPTEHDYEVHDVPAVPQIGAFMENKTKRHQLDPCLKAEYPNKIWLSLLLWEWHSYIGQQDLQKSHFTVSAMTDKVLERDTDCTYTRSLQRNRKITLGWVHYRSYIGQETETASFLLKKIVREVNGLSKIFNHALFCLVS